MAICILIGDTDDYEYYAILRYECSACGLRFVWGVSSVEDYRFCPRHCPHCGQQFVQERQLRQSFTITDAGERGDPHSGGE